MGGVDMVLNQVCCSLLRDVIERTGDVALVTDAERRYGNLLFEICHENEYPRQKENRLAKNIRHRLGCP
jgi:hypothetical protein